MTTRDREYIRFVKKEPTVVGIGQQNRLVSMCERLLDAIEEAHKLCREGSQDCPCAHAEKVLERALEGKEA